MTITVTVRYFAGARAAAGVEQEHVDLPEGAVLSSLVDALMQRHGAGLTRVLASASFLLDEVVASVERPIRDGAQVDVLPPFAGG